MTQAPGYQDTPFSLPNDVPRVMPIDYPELDSNVDMHEAYDEGLDDILDCNPYEIDDDPIKSSLLSGHNPSTVVHQTTDHETVIDWANKRLGYPARTTDGDDWGGSDLRIIFANEELDGAMTIDWDEFFTLFEKHQLAFVFRHHANNGVLSYFYKFVNRADAELF